MRHIPENYCAEFMEDLRSRTTCNWCKHPRRSIRPRIGLCDHCNRQRLQLKKLEAEAQTFAQEHSGITWGMEHELKIHREMIECAKTEGQRYGKLFDDDLQPLTFEHEWRFLSKRF